MSPTVDHDVGRFQIAVQDSLVVRVRQPRGDFSKDLNRVPDCQGAIAAEPIDLRETIARECEARRGVAVDPDQVIVTSGTSPAILLCLNLLVDPGDEVILATPHYPCYPNMISVCGGRPVLVPTGPQDGFIMDVAKDLGKGHRDLALKLGEAGNAERARYHLDRALRAQPSARRYLNRGHVCVGLGLQVDDVQMARVAGVGDLR